MYLVVRSFRGGSGTGSATVFDPSPQWRWLRDTLNKHCFLLGKLLIAQEIPLGADIRSRAGASSARSLTVFDWVKASRAYYTALSSSFFRLINRLTRAQVTKSRCAFFFSPRYRTFTNPNCSFIT